VKIVLFPGQGSQYVGMGKDIAHTSEVARRVFQEVDDCVGLPISLTMMEGDPELLRRTDYAQPAIFAVSVALIRMLEEEGVSFSSTANFTAGHSLGEYSALYAAGVFSVGDGARLLQKRAMLMQQVSDENSSGTMRAFLGISAKELMPVVEHIRETEKPDLICDLANDNSSQQVVLSGYKYDLDIVEHVLRTKHMTKCINLSVGGAFHSRLMDPVKPLFKEYVNNTIMHDPKIPVIMNTTSKPVISCDEIRDCMINQVCSTVLWKDTVDYCVEQGVGTFIEIGPGKVISKMIARENAIKEKNCSVSSIQNIDDMKKFLSKHIQED